MAEPVSTPEHTQEGVTPESTFPGLQNPSLKHTSKRDFDDSFRPEKRPRLDPPQLTAALAYSEISRSAQPQPASTGSSPNPSHQALSALMGANSNLVSQATKATSSPDPATTISEPLAVVAENIQQPSAAGTEAGDSHAAQTSPTSISSMGTLESMAVASGLTTTVGSPLPIEETVRQVVHAGEAGEASPHEGNKAFSYPAPLLQPQVNDGAARRGMSLPHSGTRQGTRSPSSKKHRCPYCNTEFTRHHNLKSHLLTHSQEKPYVCSTCQARFRRLHDLKRHTKLHTGERPHICPKCGRKFARGDALARHNKGSGGCAGRRSSIGSYGGDDMDDGGDDTMEGVMYNEPESIDDEEGNDRRPAIRRQAPSGDDTLDDPDHSNRIPSTYPPIQGRPQGGIAGGFFPQPRGTFNPSASASGSSGAPSSGPLPFPSLAGSGSGSRPGAPGSSQVFAPNPITESPKPLSPGQSQRGSAADARHRSPSMTHYQQPSYSRVSGSSSLGIPAAAPQLPPPHGLNPPDPRFTLPSQGPAHPPTQPSGPPTHMSGSGPLSSHSNSLSSHGQSGHGSGENPKFADKDRLWAMVHNLEQKVNSMADEMSALRQEITMLRGQQKMA